MRVWLRLTFAYFCSYLHVLVFHYFVSCQTALAFCKCCCRNLSKIIENDAKNLQTSYKIHPRWTKVVPRSAPKTILEAGRFQERSQGGPVSVFLSILRGHLGDFVRNFGPSWVPREAQNRGFWDPTSTSIGHPTVKLQI